MRRDVSIDGRILTVEKPWSGNPRLLVDGAELPRDRYRRYLLDGQVVTSRFDLRHLAPSLKVGDRRVLTVEPLPAYGWLLLGPVVVLALRGGAIGAGLGVAAAFLAADRLRKPGVAGILAAVGIVAAAALLYLAVAFLIAQFLD